MTTLTKVVLKDIEKSAGSHLGQNDNWARDIWAHGHLGQNDVWAIDIWAHGHLGQNEDACFLLAQMSTGPNVNGPNVILAQMSMGPNVSGPNVHSGPNVLGPNVFGPIVILAQMRSSQKYMILALNCTQSVGIYCKFLVQEKNNCP